MSAPQSIADVETLIQRLYRPGEPHVAIQEQLQTLQKSPEGWQLGDALLSSTDANVRFFGALTFTVKLNGQFDDDTAVAVLERLKYWLSCLINDIPLVLNKLSTALVTYCLRTPVPWQKPHQDLITLFGGLQSLSRSQLTALLFFSSSLAEETDRMEHAQHAALHLRMAEEISEVNELMKYGLQTARADALHCFLAWTTYAQPRWSSKNALQQLQTLTTPMMECLLDNDDDIKDVALSIFTDLLESYIAFFHQQHIELFAKIIETTCQGPPSSPQFCQLIIAYGVAIVENVVKDPRSSSAQVVLKRMMAILQLPFSFEDEEEDLTMLCVDFWNAFVEFAAENYDMKAASLDYVKSIISQVVRLLWRKIFIPTTFEFGEKFKTCRSDTADLVGMAYMVLDADLCHLLIDLLAESLRNDDWQGAEAAVFMLNAVADNVLEYDTLDNVLGPAIHSLFTTNANNYVRRTIIDMVGHYGDFLHRNPTHLLDAVRYLFASLDTPLANAAARSIFELCSACRNKLTGDLDAFLGQYSTLTDPYVKEKVVGGIAAIVQALKPEESKVEPLLRLVQSIKGQGIITLRCLAAMAKGSQTTEDGTAEETEFWHENGKVFQDKVVSCFVLDGTGEAIEAVCAVIRAGCTEITGPFALPPSITVDLLRQCTVATPQVESVLDVAAMLIVRHSRSREKNIIHEAQAILEHAVSFMRALGHPSEDPSVSSCCFEIVKALLKRYFSLVAGHEAVAFMLNFTVQAIEAHDMVPKRSALDLYTKLIKHKGGKGLVLDVGPVLTQALIRQIAGVGQRSDLDSVNEPLKALFAQYPAEAKHFVEAALWSDDFPDVNGRVGDAEKRRFFAQLVALRGGSKTKDIVMDFFAACRGVVTSYS